MCILSHTEREYHTIRTPNKHQPVPHPPAILLRKPRQTHNPPVPYSWEVNVTRKPSKPVHHENMNMNSTSTAPRALLTVLRPHKVLRTTTSASGNQSPTITSFLGRTEERVGAERIELSNDPSASQHESPPSRPRYIHPPTSPAQRRLGGVNNPTQAALPARGTT